MIRSMTMNKRMMNLNWFNLSDTICQPRFRSRVGLVTGGARSWSPALRRKVRGDDQMTDTWAQISRVISVFKQMHSQHSPTYDPYHENI